MLGKVGYVYQASNFHYVGYGETDFYLMEGVKIPPPSQGKQKGCLQKMGIKEKTIRPTQEQMKQYNMNHYRGRQFKYIYFLANKKRN